MVAISTRHNPTENNHTTTNLSRPRRLEREIPGQPLQDNLAAVPTGDVGVKTLELYLWIISMEYLGNIYGISMVWLVCG